MQAFQSQAWPARVEIREVGLRDGLQILPQVVPTEVKLQWIEAAHAAGQRELEVGSFVPARLMPQLADTAELVAFARRLPGLRASVLVPNLKGAQRAFECEAHALLVPLSASHAHSLANLRRAPDDVVAEIGRIVELRDSLGAHTRVEVGISTAFGCTLQGAVAPDEVLRLLRAVLDAGVDSVGLADTVGYADPRAVRELFSRGRALAAAWGGDRLNTAHFHDTRGLGQANVVAALDCGVSRLDACLGGLGGCPHAPGASGNVATEDVVYLMRSMGIATGQDFAALMALRQRLGEWLPGVPLHGNIWRAGLPRTLQAAPTGEALAAH